MHKAKITELTIYPVKSLQGVDLQEAELTEYGLKWDRFWMIINEDGQFATQRQLSQMAQISTQITHDELILNYQDKAPLHIPLKLSQAKTKQAKVWSSECLVWDEGEEARNWLTDVIGLWRGQKLSLVRMAPDFDREVSQKHTQGAVNYTYFADGYPYLICNTASLDALNNKLSEQDIATVPMSRFRANIVVDSQSEFIEHQYSSMAVNDEGSMFHLCKPCQRCKVIGLDQSTGEEVTQQQPLKTLMSMSHVEKKGAYFGHNAVITGAAKPKLPRCIRVGDEVRFFND